MSKIKTVLVVDAPEHVMLKPDGTVARELSERRGFTCKKYQSQRDLFEQESFSVVKDGKEHTHICIKDLVQLDAAQDKAVSELKKAIEKCIDLGVMLAADCSNIVALNTNNFKTFGIGYDGDYEYDEHTEEYFKYGRTINNRISIVDCDEELFFERKDEE